MQSVVALMEPKLQILRNKVFSLTDALHCCAKISALRPPTPPPPNVTCSLPQVCSVPFSYCNSQQRSSKC